MTAEQPPATKARAKLKPGHLYAILGVDGNLYAGQSASQSMVGFFRWRDSLSELDAALACPVMFRCGVFQDSIGRALRAGVWTHIGKRELHPGLRDEPVLVQWPMFTSQVRLWKGAEVLGTTSIDDPSIQELEVIAAWCAQHHIPHRLPAEFNDDSEGWSWRGRVKDMRRQREAQGLIDLPR